MKKPKVLQILAHYDYPIAGYSTRSQEIVKNIGRFCDPIIMTNQPDGDNRRVRRVGGFKLYKVPDLPFRIPYLGSRIIKPYLLTKVFQKIIKENKIDLIHAHTPYTLSQIPIRLAQKQGIPIIYETRGLWEESWVTNEGNSRDHWLYRKIRDEETKTMRSADKNVVISQGLYNNLAKRGIPKSKIVLVPNGVDLNNFKPVAKDRKLIKKYHLSGKKVIGYIGTIKRMEGLDLMIRALAKIKDKEIVLMIVGHGDQESALKNLARKMGVTNQVIFAGKIGHDQIFRYYSIIDIMIYPRLPEKVADTVTPLKPLEAMAMGKFVLASDVGGLKELVIPKTSGALFEAGNANDLAKKIDYYFDQPVNRNRIGKRAQEWVKRNRNWQILAQRYKRIYADLMGGRIGRESKAA